MQFQIQNSSSYRATDTGSLSSCKHSYINRFLRPSNPWMPIFPKKYGAVFEKKYIKYITIMARFRRQYIVPGAQWLCHRELARLSGRFVNIDTRCHLFSSCTLFFKFLITIQTIFLARGQLPKTILLVLISCFRMSCNLILFVCSSLLFLNCFSSGCDLSLDRTFLLFFFFLLIFS